jgi:hypothetical protein
MCGARDIQAVHELLPQQQGANHGRLENQAVDGEKLDALG